MKLILPIWIRLKIPRQETDVPDTNEFTDGFSIIEAVVAIGILVLGFSAILSALVRANTIGCASAQRLAAVSACRDAIEQLRSKHSGSVQAGNLTNSEEIILYGSSDNPARCLKAVRTVAITDLVDPRGADVEVIVCWNYRGREYSQIMRSIVYDKQAKERPYIVQGSLSGLININPKNSPDFEFDMETLSGTIITRDDLHDSFGGYSGPAKRVHVKPKGGGKQSGIIYNGEPYVMENRLCYEMLAEAMDVNLHNDHVSKKGKAQGRWWIQISASHAMMRVMK